MPFFTRFSADLVRAGVLVVGLGGAESACRSPTEITFLISTDQPCTGVKGTAISVGVLGAQLDSKPATTTSTFCDPTTHSLGSLVVVPSGGNDAELAVRIVTGTTIGTDACIQNNFKGGCIVARRAIHFIPHSPVTVPVEMDGSCIDNPCAPNSTCHNGVCVNVVVDCIEGTCDGGSTSVASGPGSWKPMSKSPLAGRGYFAGIALGRSMFIWGGYMANAYLSDGAIYDVAGDKWTMLPTSPLENRGNMAVAESSSGDILIWGGTDNSGPFNDGVVYSNGTWTSMTANAPIAARESAVAVWSDVTGEMIIFGGDDGDPGHPLADGAAYKLSTKTWRLIKASPLAARTGASGVLAGGNVLVVYGGHCGSSGVCGDYAVYDPKADTWSAATTPGTFDSRASPAAVTIGGRAVFWGGGTTDDLTNNDGISIDPATGAKIAIPSPGSILSPADRWEMGSWAAGNVMYVFGGHQGKNDLSDGASFDTTTSTWTAMPSANLSARWYPGAVWTGTEAIVWGGAYGNNPIIFYRDDGAVFTP